MHVVLESNWIIVEWSSVLLSLLDVAISGLKVEREDWQDRNTNVRNGKGVSL